MKKILFRLSLILVVAATAIAACGGTPTPTQEPQVVEVTRVVAGTPVVEQVIVTATPEPAEPEQAFRVAIVMPSSITDAAFSQSMFEALLAVQNEMGGESKVEIAYSISSMV